MTEDINPADVFDEVPSTEAAPKPRSRRKKADVAPMEVVAAPSGATPSKGRVTIILEENPDIPPNGQFVGFNGKGYLLVPGHKVSVPVGVVSVLNDAVEKRPVLGNDGVISGWRDALRFPYRIVHD